MIAPGTTVSRLAAIAAVLKLDLRDVFSPGDSRG
jgi:hypothetical protein